MGTEIRMRSFTRDDRRQFRRKVQACVSVLDRMLRDDAFIDVHEPPEPQLGMEIEFNLVRDDMAPAMSNLEVLEAIDDASVFQTELGQFNVEMNVEPGRLTGDATIELEEKLRQSLRRADERMHRQNAQLVMVGMLPTLELHHLGREWITANPRYEALNEQIFAARGEDIELDLDGVPLPGTDVVEQLRADTNSVVPEAACTSLQLHLRVAPEEFAAHWNAAQCLAGVQVALAANSPFLAGKALWHESRIPLFAQATDTRTLELKNQGVRPRVWFGERWIDSVIDLFQENSRYFPALLPEVSEADPETDLAAGRVPELRELQMHNGTIYRWNRPVYDIADGHPHLRIENRVLPAGPTVLDMMANAAFYYGALRALVDAELPIWHRMSFDAAQGNLGIGAKYGLDARLYWPGLGWVGADELVLRRLLPLAHAGLEAFGLSSRAQDRYLGIIEQRSLSRQTGAAWQRAQIARREAAGADRRTALTEMMRDYVRNMAGGRPVHEWEA
ncbi:glutamate-cysteine ligase family protein [Rhodococcus sp. HM1]|uniref:glutamate-cysteine ligase family protein n=1 Tax=unclassified Rhodococcus (in: high G+C Gram-positive bacteria) TaxID=192944 RepID=UPI0018CFE9B0|nr:MULTISPECIES: glutamate-cysteine ligase family protein [unclassified Rhodococcus (in: high G+C Gram-positive bacteria)]MBH0118539.1 glutamate--cysteine ligase [Rhodococcus sp. CX]MCK8674170.1 glutamate-cysteine ligase family protein [Rhodococcus sp. HM1]